jgi:hypothetical protein
MIISNISVFPGPTGLPAGHNLSSGMLVEGTVAGILAGRGHSILFRWEIEGEPEALEAILFGVKAIVKTIIKAIIFQKTKATATKPITKAIHFFEGTTTWEHKV